VPDRMIVNTSPLVFLSRVGGLTWLCDLAAKRMSWIVAARPVVERLLGDGLYLSPSLVAQALAEVGE
jgi:hypothetical protein